MSLPILYSLRQCPYAMRARLGLLLAQQPVMLRDIVMTNIPEEMFEASPKGEVPVLVLGDGTVIDESIDIMRWALNINDPQDLLYKHHSNLIEEIKNFIKHNDNKFVEALKKYKAASRYHDNAEVERREECEIFIQDVEGRLSKQKYIFGDEPSLADYAILPFIRQFSRVDRKWFLQSPYQKLRNWLERHYQNPLFSKAMKKYPQWLDAKEDIFLVNNYHILTEACKSVTDN